MCCLPPPPGEGGRSWVALRSTCLVYLRVNFHAWNLAKRKQGPGQMTVRCSVNMSGQHGLFLHPPHPTSLRSLPGRGFLRSYRQFLNRGVYDATIQRRCMRRGGARPPFDVSGETNVAGVKGPSIHAFLVFWCCCCLFF